MTAIRRFHLSCDEDGCTHQSTRAQPAATPSQARELAKPWHWQVGVPQLETADLRLDYCPEHRKDLP